MYIYQNQMPLLLSLSAHCLPINSFQLRIWAFKGYSCHYNNYRISSPYLAWCDTICCCLRLMLWLYDDQWIYHAIKPLYNISFLVTILMTGRGVRLTHAFVVFTYTFPFVRYWVIRIMTHQLFWPMRAPIGSTSPQLVLHHITSLLPVLRKQRLYFIIVNKSLYNL